MDIFEVSILKISRVAHGKRGVFVDAVTDTYGVTTVETLYFSNRVWPRIQAQMMFLESERDSADYGNYVEHLPDDEYYRRFEHDIRKFTDEELVTEINRRVNETSMFSAGHIEFETKAVYKKTRRK